MNGAGIVDAGCLLSGRKLTLVC